MNIDRIATMTCPSCNKCVGTTVDIRGINKSSVTYKNDKKYYFCSSCGKTNEVKNDETKLDGTT